MKLNATPLEEWECLAFGSPDLPTLPKMGINMRLKAIKSYLTAVMLYRMHGLPPVRAYLKKLQSTFSAFSVNNEEEAIRLARRESVYLRAIWGRLVLESAVCLPRSVSLCAGLISLGLPARVVLGRRYVTFVNDVDFHAWVEVFGTPVNDRPKAQAWFQPIARFPEE